MTVLTSGEEADLEPLNNFHPEARNREQSSIK